MARTNSKRYKKNKQPILENFIEKVAEKTGDTNYLVNPSGEISMSDAISQVIAPYKDDAPDYHAFRTLVTFACFSPISCVSGAHIHS